jgi:hypothetical protein
MTTMYEIKADPHAQLVPAAPAAVALARPSWIRRAGYAAPAVLPTAVLLAARWWSVEGAEHSIGDGILSGAAAGGALLVGWVSATNADHLSRGAAVGFSLAGTAAAAGVVAYSGGMALPVLLWTMASGLALKLTSLARAAEQRHQQRLAEAEAQRRTEDERRELAAAAGHQRRELAAAARHQQAMQRAVLDSRTAVTVAALQAFSTVSAAELDASARVALAELAAGAAHSTLPGMDRDALPPTERPALAAYLAGSEAGSAVDDRWLSELSAN